jgi:hypothetical protein
VGLNWLPYNAAMPLSSSMKLALDRLAAIGATPADQRNAVAVLALLSGGVDPRKLSNSRRAFALSEQLDLGLAGWDRIMALLERAGVIGLART